MTTRILRSAAVGLLGLLALTACSSAGGPPSGGSTQPLDTDSRAYPGSRSGESLAGVLKEFDVALPAQAADVHYYVETSVDTRDLYLAFAASPAEVRGFLSGFAPSGTTPVDLDHTDPGCLMLCTSSMPTALPWHLQDGDARVRNLSGNTKTGNTVDFAFDQRNPSSYTVYLHVISIGS